MLYVLIAGSRSDRYMCIDRGSGGSKDKITSNVADATFRMNADMYIQRSSNNYHLSHIPTKSNVITPFIDHMFMIMILTPDERLSFIFHLRRF